VALRAVVEALRSDAGIMGHELAEMMEDRAFTKRIRDAASTPLSMQAIAHRCKQIGAIDPDQYILFRKQISARQWRKREPLDDEIPLERPKLLLKAWKLLLEKGVVCEASFDEEVGFSLEFVERLSGEIPAPKPREDGPNIRLLRVVKDDASSSPLQSSSMAMPTSSRTTSLGVDQRSSSQRRRGAGGALC
jgi:hypothetical protein